MKIVVHNKASDISVFEFSIQYSLAAVWYTVPYPNIEILKFDLISYNIIYKISIARDCLLSKL